MKISTLSGHLTQTNKVHIKAIFQAGLNCAKVNRIKYDIHPDDGFYKVFIVEVDNSIVMREKIRKSKATFKIN